MRIVLVSAALLALSACAGEPPPGGVLPPPGLADRAPTTPLAEATIVAPAPAKPVPLAAAPSPPRMAARAPRPLIAEPRRAPPPPPDIATRAPTPLIAETRPAPVVRPTTVVAEARPASVFRPAPVVPKPAPVEPMPFAAAPPPGIVFAPAAPPPLIAANPVPPPRAVAHPVAAIAAARPAAVPPPSPAVVPAVFVPRWSSWLFGHPPAASPGRMTLSNFTFGLAHVEALITPYPDCVVRPGMVPIDLKLPLNSTETVTAPPGTDVCWRRMVERPPGAALRLAGPPQGAWTPWNRVFTSFGHSVDAHL